MSYQIVDQTVLSTPVIGEASHMRDKERNIGIFGCNELHDRDFADRIVEYGNRKRARDVAHLARQPPIVTMHLDTDESVFFNRDLDELADPPAVAHRVNEGESEKAVGSARHDAR